MQHHTQPGTDPARGPATQRLDHIPDNACPGPCNAGARKAVDTYQQAREQHAKDLTAWENTPPGQRGDRPAPPEPPEVRVVTGDPVWSTRCQQIIRRALAELDDLASLLAATADGHRGLPSRDQVPAATTRRRPGSTSPSPIADTLDELYGALVGAEDDWREFRGYAPRPQRPRDGHARRLTITWLLDELDSILAHPGSVGFGRGVLSWQRRLRLLTKSDPVGTLSPIRCPRCSEVQVRRQDDGYWQCGSCGRLLNEAEHAREKDEQAQAQEAAETARAAV